MQIFANLPWFLRCGKPTVICWNSVMLDWKVLQVIAKSDEKNIGVPEWVLCLGGAVKIPSDNFFQCGKIS